MQTKTNKDGRLTDDENNGKKLFTDEEYELLMLAATMGKSGATKKQMWRFIKVCEEMRSHALMLETIQRGIVAANGYKGNEPLFGLSDEDYQAFL